MSITRSMTKAVKMPRGGLQEKFVELEDTQKAVMNLLVDLNVEKTRLEETHRATLNLLEDFGGEKTRLEETQGAILNILDDAGMEKQGSEDTRQATFNILEDSNIEKMRLEETQQAALNLLDDFNIEKIKVEDARAKDEALLASIGEGLVAVDKNGKTIVVNLAAEKMLGWKVEEMIGKTFFEFARLEDKEGKIIPLHERPVEMARASGTTTTTTAEYYYVRKDGTKLPVSIAATPVMVAGKNIGAVEVFRDITREKEIEKLRVDFLSLASHQLRTPLSGTKWLIETMQRGVIGAITSKQKGYLDEIYNINERMIKLVFDMLNVLRLESGVVSPKNELVSVSMLFEELQTMMAAAAKNRGVLLRNALKDHRKFEMETDFQMLKNILETFVSNAINYSMPGQEVILDVKEETTNIVFFVQDSGIGIPKEEQKIIFERFYRGSNAKALKPDGTGLGLYIASLLADKIGAKILFESEEGKGATFYLRIPRSK